MRWICTAICLFVFSMTANANIDDLINGNFSEKIIANSNNNITYPTDLDFNPNAPEQLWILNHGQEDGGTTVMIENPGTESVTYDYRKDGNAWHFMVYASAIAFGDGHFTTAQDYYNANRAFFGGWCGPTLWPSDLEIYAVVGNPPTSGVNGSHLDMVHQSPYTSGVAYETERIYWVNEGVTNSIARYDWGEPHYPGGADHDDGQVYRHVDVPYEMNKGVPAHMIIEGDWLYYINPGTGNVNRLDITTGTTGNTIPNPNGDETLQTFVEVNGTVWETVIDNGLISPSGIDIFDGYLAVSDNSNGHIVIYDMNDFSEVARINTAATSIMGIKFDADGNLYYVDHVKNEVVKLDAAEGLRIFAESNTVETSEGSNTMNITFENNSSQEVMINSISENIDNMFVSNSVGLNVSLNTDLNLPLTIAANESLTIPVELNYSSGNGIFEVNLDFNITHGEDDMTLSESVLGFTEEIPLVYVYDDIDNNFNTADLRGLLNTTGYSDYINMSSVDFRNYALRANGLKTLVWNAGSFGTTNGQEYSSFDDLRENGTSIYYLGDGPLLIANIEESFNLDAFGAAYGGTYSYGFSSGGTYSLNGVSGDPISDEFNTLNMGLTLFQSQGQTSAWPTIYTRPTDENTFSIFSHTISADSSVAVRNETENSRSVISSFNMSNIENSNQRADVFESIMDWLTFQDATGIFDLAGYEEFSVYPNPAVNEIRFKSEMNPDQISLMDISGKTILNISKTQNSIDVSQLISGTYFLMIIEGDEIKVSKFIKQ